MSPRIERCARNWLLGTANGELLPSSDAFVGETGAEEDPVSEENRVVDMEDNALKGRLPLEDDGCVAGGDVVEDDNADNDDDDDAVRASDVVVCTFDVLGYASDAAVCALDVVFASAVSSVILDRSPEKER